MEAVEVCGDVQPMHMKEVGRGNSAIWIRRWGVARARHGLDLATGRASYGSATAGLVANRKRQV